MTKTITPRKPGQSHSPFRGLFPRNMFEDLFEQYFSNGDSQLSEVLKASMDVAETETAFEVKMDLPGVSAENVDIQIDNNTLTVRGHRSDETEDTDEERHFHRVERYSGSFSRSVLLPNSINEDEAVAEFKDGVLKIVIPKTEDAKPRKIQISK